MICVFGSAGSVGTEEVLKCGAKICVLNSERKLGKGRIKRIYRPFLKRKQ